MKKNINFLFSLFVVSLLLSLSFGVLVKAATEGTVTATVTAQNIAVTVTDGSVAYGTIATSATSDTTSNGLDDSQTATNTGNVTADLDIKGQNGTGGATWTLATSIGANQYKHDFCINNCDSSPTWVGLTTSYQTLVNGLAASATQVFDTRVSVPSSVTDFVQKSVDVTILISI